MAHPFYYQLIVLTYHIEISIPEFRTRLQKYRMASTLLILFGSPFALRIFSSTTSNTFNHLFQPFNSLGQLFVLVLQRIDFLRVLQIHGVF